MEAAIRAATEGVMKVAQRAAKEAQGAAEEAIAKAEAAVPSSLVKKVISSWEFKFFLIIILLGSIMGAVSISLGLSLLGQ